MAASENWKPVIGYEGIYEVSDVGNVRSMPRVDSRGIPRGGHSMTVQINSRNGYPVIALTIGGAVKLRRVHQLMLESFVGPRPLDAVARHLDDNRTNNTLVNLTWGTHKENADDRALNQRTARGVRNGGGVKLTERLIPIIRSRIGAGEPIKRLARELGVSDTALRFVRDGKTWSHVL